ncbi:unnamed protein product [Thelazia callipaeda]|uniref:SKA2 domain-containing protein n=1 Tax=Thelazia callipaeda TaxID=103827 RepID=A0A0N5CSN3_THECL|nr:unnamed protein product [Thelazia callipaeda]
MAEGVDSKGRVLPRQMIRIQRTEPEENVVRTELRYVIYQSKRHLDDKALYEAELKNTLKDNVVSEAVQCLMKKYAEMNSGYALPPHVPTIDATKFAKKLPEEEIQTSPTSPTSPKYISDKEWIAEAYRRLQMVAKRVQNIEKSATLIGPEFSHFQAQLTSLLTDLEERKRAGASPDAIYNDEYFCEKLEQLQQFAAKTACFNRAGSVAYSEMAVTLGVKHICIHRRLRASHEAVACSPLPNPKCDCLSKI